MQPACEERCPAAPTGCLPPGPSTKPWPMVLNLSGITPESMCRDTLYHKTWGLPFLPKLLGGPGGLSGNTRSVLFPPPEEQSQVRAGPCPWEVPSWEDRTGSHWIQMASPTCTAGRTVTAQTLGSRPACCSFRALLTSSKMLRRASVHSSNPDITPCPCRQNVSADRRLSTNCTVTYLQLALRAGGRHRVCDRRECGRFGIPAGGALSI